MPAWTRRRFVTILVGMGIVPLIGKEQLNKKENISTVHKKLCRHKNGTRRVRLWDVTHKVCKDCGTFLREVL